MFWQIEAGQEHRLGLRLLERAGALLLLDGAAKLVRDVQVIDIALVLVKCSDNA